MSLIESMVGSIEDNNNSLTFYTKAMISSFNSGRHSLSWCNFRLALYEFQKSLEPGRYVIHNVDMEITEPITVYDKKAVVWFEGPKR